MEPDEARLWLLEVNETMSRILFISNSTNYGRGFLDHAEAEIRSILGGIRRVLFVPYALYDRDRYSKLVSERFACMGIEIEPIHISQDPATAARKAAAVFVGGGNTFRLLDHLQRHGLIQTVREAVHRGARVVLFVVYGNIPAPCREGADSLRCGRQFFGCGNRVPALVRFAGHGAAARRSDLDRKEHSVPTGDWSNAS